MKNLLGLALLASVAAWAQPGAEGLLSDSTAVSGDELRARLSGKSFEWRAPGVPVTAKIKYDASGEAFINVSNGDKDTGSWKVEGMQMCTYWKQLRPTCAREVRAKGELLLFRRGDGNWATMTPE